MDDLHKEIREVNLGNVPVNLEDNVLAFKDYSRRSSSADVPTGNLHLLSTTWTKNIRT